MNKLINKILLFFILISSFSLKAQKVKTFLDTNIIEIGQQINLNIKIENNNNKIIVFPFFKDTIITGIEILNNSEIDTIKQGNQTFLLKKYLISSFEDSAYQIPAIPIVIGNDTLLSDSTYLLVRNPNFDSTFVSKLDTTQLIPIFDIKEQENIPWTFKEFWKNYGKTIILIIIGLIIIGLIITLIIIIIKRKKNNIPIIPKKIIPAHIIALEKIDALKQKQLWQKGKTKQYYTELTDILREFLENRFKIKTFEKTSAEILFQIKKSALIQEDEYNELTNIFFLSDMVKFAKGEPVSHENELCIQNTRKIINNNKEEKEVESEENNNQT